MVTGKSGHQHPVVPTLLTANAPHARAELLAAAGCYIDTRAVQLLNGDGRIVMCYCHYHLMYHSIYIPPYCCALPFQTAWGNTNHTAG